MKSRQAKAHDFSDREREKIYERDRGCIFCKIRYRMLDTTGYGRQMLSIMHYIPRSKGGLGIEQNGAVGCISHHHMLDNGSRGERKDMMIIFEEYLRNHYQDWNRDKLIYKKWKF